MSKLLVGIAIVLIAIVAIIGVLWYIGNNNIQQYEYCNNWYERIEQEKVRLGESLWASESEYALLNQDINDYNRQCAY